MERVRKSKVKPTVDSVVFSSPEQRLLRFLVSECTTSFTPRVLSSKLKGVRGLGGTDGINKILKQLQEVGLVQFHDNNRAVGAHNDHVIVRLLKTFISVCDLEGVQQMVEPLSTRGVLFGSRAVGQCRSDSDYDLFVVTDTPDQVRELVETHPLGRRIELVAWSTDDYLHIQDKDPGLAQKIEGGVVLWGSTW